MIATCYPRGNNKENNTLIVVSERTATSYPCENNQEMVQQIGSQTNPSLEFEIKREINPENYAMDKLRIKNLVKYL